MFEVLKEICQIINDCERDSQSSGFGKQSLSGFISRCPGTPALSAGCRPEVLQEGQGRSVHHQHHMQSGELASDSTLQASVSSFIK